MHLDAFHELATSLPGVRRTTAGGRARWQYQGRLVARELDATHVVVRVPFEVRADLGAGEDGLVEDAVHGGVAPPGAGRRRFLR